MSIAVLSDTHGNLTAFEAVLADIESRGISRIFHLGDVIGKGPRGDACCDLARQHCELVLMGNWEAGLLLGKLPKPNPTLTWWREEVSVSNRHWLSQLPFSEDFALAGVQVRAYHASADDLFHRVYPTVSGAEWDGMFANTRETGNGPEPDLVVYGDIHRTWSRSVGNRAVLNCGSVGNPLDEPTASYIVLEDSSDTLKWETIRVQYDIEAELEVARETDMPLYKAWEHELRTAEYGR